MVNKVLYLVPLVWMGSCVSATHEIAKTTNEVRALAIESEEAARNIQTLTEDPLILAGTDTIIDDQLKIQKKADYVSLQIPKVKDVIPWWATTIKYLAFLGSALAICFVLWYTGIGFIIKKALWSFGLLIPTPTKLRADFDAKAIDEGSASPSRREAIAASRGADPAYNAAFKKHLTKRKTKGL